MAVSWPVRQPTLDNCGNVQAQCRLQTADMYGSNSTLAISSCHVQSTELRNISRLFIVCGERVAQVLKSHMGITLLQPDILDFGIVLL